MSEVLDETDGEYVYSIPVSGKLAEKICGYYKATGDGEMRRAIEEGRVGVPFDHLRARDSLSTYVVVSLTIEFTEGEATHLDA